MSLLAFVLAEAFIVSRGGALLGPVPALESIGLILLSALCNTAFLSLIVGFIKTQNAFGTVSSIVGTLVGFLTGIYLPIGMLPDGVQFVIKIFPLSHAALLLRRVMMENALAQVFGGVPAAIAGEFEEQMGVVFRFGNTTVPGYASLLILAGSAALFYLLSLLRFSRKAD
jgi:multidrug/hemolysin transport system permease protein